MDPNLFWSRASIARWTRQTDQSELLTWPHQPHAPPSPHPHHTSLSHGDSEASGLLVAAIVWLGLFCLAAGRVNYYKGLTTVADLQSLRLLDDQGRFRKHTLISFILPNVDGTSACALEQLGALRFPHLFFHLPGTIFEMIQVFVDPATELTEALLPIKASQADACRSFLFIPQNATIAAAVEQADAEGRRLVAHSQRELEGWFWALQWEATGPFAFKNDFANVLSIYRETRRSRKLEMQRVKHRNDGQLGGDWAAKDKPEAETLLMDVAPGERVVFSISNPICRGHTVIFRRRGGRMFARLVIGDEDMLPPSFTPSSTNSSDEKDLNGTITALGLRLKAGQKPLAWDPQRLQLTEELADLYRTRAEYNFKRLERIEHGPRRTPALTTEGYIKEPITHNTWDALLKLYEEAVEERKHMPEAQLAMTLFIENERVPLPTEVHRNRNANPLPVSTLFSEKNASHWQPMVERLVPRMAAWAGRTDIDPLVTRGLRRYYDGSMLRDHVDGSGDIAAIINMAQEAVDPWDLHILDHEGRRHRVSMEPGEMVLYQPDRVAHGRPLPLSGKSYDNLFLRITVKGMERRPLTLIEAELGLLTAHELPNALDEGVVGLDEEQGLMTEL